MRGRINVSDHEGLRSLLAMMGMTVWPAAPPRFNVPPRSTLDAVIENDETQALQLASMHWGFSANQGGTTLRHLFNARSETVFRKSSFKASAQTRRAIVPVNGYYEWHGTGQSNKSAFHICHADEPALALAAIFRPSRNLNDEEDHRSKYKHDDAGPQLSFDLDLDLDPNLRNDGVDIEDNVLNKTKDKRVDTIVEQLKPEFDVCILTTSANPQVGSIHHRMPVILDKNQSLKWIKQGDETMLKQLHHQDIQPVLQITSVGDYVNNAANEGADCLKPTKKSRFSI